MSSFLIKTSSEILTFFVLNRYERLIDICRLLKLFKFFFQGLLCCVRLFMLRYTILDEVDQVSLHSECIIYYLSDYDNPVYYEYTLPVHQIRV